MEHKMNKENEMTVSDTLTIYAGGYDWGNAYIRMLDVCHDQGFDLDDFLFEIWKETKDND
jgi:hypothetical protein